MRKVSLFLVVIFIFSLLSTDVLALSNDQVLSENIEEADGTSGQDTNSGSGVKTGHIQDDAVTTGKIVDGAITTSKITDNAVTTPKVSDGSITTSKVAVGAITPDKIGFYRNVIIVALSGGDFTNPVDALNAITDASESNPYLVKIMPGVYDVSTSVIMKSYVDIEGSGENVTKITATGIVSDNTAYCEVG